MSQARTGAAAASEIAFPVVAIAASAGGLEALEAFLKAFPAHSGVAVVFVQHLDPEHESLLPQIIRRYTSVPVVPLEKPTVPEADHLYVVCPATQVVYREGMLRPEPHQRRALPPTVADTLFTTLAEGVGARAIGVLLSGNGDDGVAGLRHIRACGGMTIVQDPESAQFQSMPQSAIDAGVADMVLAAEYIPKAIERYVSHPVISGQDLGSLLSDDGLARVLALLHEHGSSDFSSFKESTLRRRIGRRMGLRQICHEVDYLDVLRADADERTDLEQDMMINVTAFFRDPDCWSEIARQVLPKLIARIPSGEALRLWVPACATGEEAYTLAMLALEALEEAGRPADLQVFASDIDVEALATARTGRYPMCIAQDVSPRRLARFFVQANGSYCVGDQLRDHILFTRHDLVADPPFSRLDLVSLRNLLIYMKPSSQQRILHAMHFALRANGCLVLGQSETVGQDNKWFGPWSSQFHIFRSLPQLSTRIPVPTWVSARRSPHLSESPICVEQHAESITDIAVRRLARDFAPASVLVDESRQAFHFFGDTGRYLRHPEGGATSQITALARHGLAVRLRSILSQAFSVDRADPGGNEALRLRARVQDENGHYTPVLLVVRKMTSSSADGPVALVSFVPLEEEPAEDVPDSREASSSDQDVIRQLEADLQEVRRDLRSSLEDLEATNEELQTANEESMSMNEELQTSNEELESSKEELQAMNEELQVVNAQLEERVEELQAANMDLDNLIACNGVPTLFLDQQRRIRRFTPCCGDLFRLIPSDVGRPIEDVMPRFDDPRFVRDIRAISPGSAPLEAEVSLGEGAWYLRRIQPYVLDREGAGGFVVTFSDVSRIKAAEDAAHWARERAENYLKLANVIFVGVDREGRVTLVNNRTCSVLGLEKEQLLGKVWIDKFVPQNDHERLRKAFKGVMDGTIDETLAIRHQVLTRSGETRVVDWLNAPIHDEAGTVVGVLSAGEDVTERLAAVREIESLARFRAENPNPVMRFKRTGELMYANDASHLLLRHWGIKVGDKAPDSVLKLISQAFEEEVMLSVTEAVERRSYLQAFVAIPEMGYLNVYAQDVTELRALEAQLRHSQKLEAIGVLAGGVAHEINNPINGIMNYAELIKDPADPADAGEITEYADSIVELTQRVAGIVRNLLCFARQDEAAPRTLTDLEAVVTDATRLMSTVMLHDGIKPQCDLAPDLPQIFCRPQQIQQILINLLSNARDALNQRYPDGQPGKRLTVSARQVKVGNEQVVRLTVEDNGPGIPAHIQESIFTPFFTTKDRSHGTGLGLSISYGIAEDHGGRLWVESEEGEGTRFHLDLPEAKVAR